MLSIKGILDVLKNCGYRDRIETEPTTANPRMVGHARHLCRSCRSGRHRCEGRVQVVFRKLAADPDSGGRRFLTWTGEVPCGCLLCNRKAG